MINCILVDDEPLALRLLDKYVSRIDDLNLLGAYSRPDDALRHICTGEIDLAFLDIQMPGLSGLDLARTALENDTKVVFVTAYRDFAVDGFRVEALDYLLKPVNFNEFENAVERYRRTASAAVSPTDNADTITVKSDYRTLPVKIADVLYVEGLKDYVKIYVDGRDRPIITQMSLKALEAMLPPDQFLRVHRSFIVALTRVTSFGRTDLNIGTTAIPIGATYRSRVFESLAKN